MRALNKTKPRVGDPMSRRARPSTAGRHDQDPRPNVITLLDRVITSTPNTVRVLVIIVVIVTVMVGGLWVLHANLTAGSVSITSTTDSW
jgi:hypothetical protein